LPLDPADSPYTIGRSERAAAFIVDNDRPAPPCGMLGDGVFHVCAPITNRCFRVEWATNLLQWEVLGTNAVVDGIARHLDPDAGKAHHRFFRLVPVPCPADEP
jgi:hypothetical protein